MLTIYNLHKLKDYTFTIKIDMEWRVMEVQESKEAYTIAVLSMDKPTGVYSLSGAILYKLDRRARANGVLLMGRYALTNSIDKRIQYMPSTNLTLKNFELELAIQTALLC